jgi:carbohydrate-selective porin OprB
MRLLGLALCIASALFVASGVRSAASAEREWFSGDWGGVRSRWQNDGADLDVRLTQGYQDVANGSRLEDGAYGGKFDADLHFDMGRLAGWRGFSWQLRGETRFGDFANVVGTKMIPVTYLITPKASGTVTAINALNFTWLRPLPSSEGDFVMVGAGRYYGFDGGDSPFNGGGGHTTFLHLAFNGTPTNGRLVPSITNGANFAWIRNDTPFLTLSVRDAVGHPTSSGLSELFEDGATFILGINFPTNWHDSSGKQSLTGMITTRKLTPFDDRSDGLQNPFPSAEPLQQESGSWVVQYKFYHYIAEQQQRDGSTTGWGVFGTVAAAEGRTNKSALVVALGLGGTAPFATRPYDRWGIAFAIDGVSLVYRRQVGEAVRLDSENVLEAFYSYAFTRSIALTADVHVIRPMLTGSGTAVLPAIRMVVNF